MRRRTITPHRPFGEINVTPLIDVVMCLIIFYLMVGKLATDRKTPVTLPETTVGSLTEPEVLVVNIAPRVSDGSNLESDWPEATARAARVVVDTTPVTGPAALETLVRSRLAAKPSTIVQIRAEQDFEFRIVSPVMQACTRAGAPSVRLAARRVGAAAPEGGAP